MPLGPRELAAGLAAALAGDFTDPAATIVAQLRLPRTLLAASMGAVLAQQ